MTGPERRPGPPHVAVLVETSMAYGREMLHGVAEYLRENEPWTIFFEHRSLQDPAPPWLASWRGDGIITRLSPQLSEAVLKTGVPTVDVDDQAPRSHLPNVQSDHEAIGAMALEHLKERGFERFAFVGHPRFEWSNRRRDGFFAAARAAGFACEEYRSASPVTWGHQQASWESETDGLARWLSGRARPLGVMACNDFVGVQTLDACRRAGLAVPDDAAVVGVDNDVLACELAHPPLSSVIPGCRRIGYEAAALLDALMRRGGPSRERADVPPIGVAVRRSTDVSQAIGDPLVARALRFIREHARDNLRVEDVSAHVDASRSVLQRRFRQALDRTVHETIAESRVQLAKRLLVETDLPLPDVASRSGFSHAEYLSVAFRRAVGSTPGAYRRENRKPPAPPVGSAPGPRPAEPG
ncbi:AraC family transcriptional regulator [Paludisphaera soli]|uniref:AraC family transcriptional regulator n=1 Tax=Paludisphaera soli TaxID=2712865 RepID=UPI0013EB450B|nr:DNA-binding transcriptional regulator [Paludisphaera soli]